MRFLLDASVYLLVLLDRELSVAIEPTLRWLAPRVRLSSVMRAELTQGARGDQGRALVEVLTRSPERAARVASPSHADWVRAGTIRSKTRDAHPGLRGKRLLNERLIACGARSAGAVLVTDNRRDFAVIDRWLPPQRIDAADLLRISSPVATAGVAAEVAAVDLLVAARDGVRRVPRASEHPSRMQ